MSTETQTPQIHARLAAVLAEVEAITKTRQNQAQGFKFRGIDDVYNALHDIFARQQIYVLPEIVEWAQTDRPTKNGGQQLHTVVKMRYRFTTTDGSERVTETPGEAADTGDKGLGKACQYAYKLALLQMFLVPTEGDNDPDARSVEWGANQQRQPAQRRDTKPQTFREEYGQKPDPKPDWMGLIAKARSRVEIEGVRVALDAALRREGAPPRDNPKVRATLAALDAKEAELSIGGAG